MRSGLTTQKHEVNCSHRKFIDGDVVYRFKQEEEWITCSVDVSSSISVSNIWTMYSLGYYFSNENTTVMLPIGYYLLTKKIKQYRER